MRKKLFIFFVLATFANCFYANPTDSRRTIELKVKHKIERRSILPSPPTAFITGTLLEIHLNNSCKNATILIINKNSGEELFHEENALNEEIITIDLFDMKSNNDEYSLYIFIDKEMTINGDFIIE